MTLLESYIEKLRSSYHFYDTSKGPYDDEMTLYIWTWKESIWDAPKCVKEGVLWNSMIQRVTLCL